MIELNKQNKLPSKVKWHDLTNIILLLLLLSSPLLLFSKLLCGVIFLTLFIFLGLPIFIYSCLYYSFLTFVVENDRIAINSGVIIKRSKSIPFDKVQSVDNTRGIIARFFGLSSVNIWTSSPEQLQVHKKEVAHRPDGRLELSTDDADWLKSFILSKRS